MMPLWHSLARALIAGCSGIGVACVTNHLTKRPNAAYLASILVTGFVVALLNQMTRSEADTSPSSDLAGSPSDPPTFNGQSASVASSEPPQPAAMATLWLELPNPPLVTRPTAGSEETGGSVTQTPEKA